MLEGRWVPVPPEYADPEFAEWALASWVETCPQDRMVLLPGDSEAVCHRWEWVPYEEDQTFEVAEWPIVNTRLRRADVD